MLRSSWPTVIAHLRSAGKAVLPSFLEIATPAAYDGQTLELVFPPDRPLGVQKVSEREGELRQALQDLFGVAPAIRCVIREPVAGIPEPVEDEPLSEEEALAQLSAELGATPVDRGRRVGVRGPIQDLIDELSRLPGIGPKSAQRLAFHLVKAPPDEAKRLAEAIVRAKELIFFCRECGNVAEGELCRICRDEGRERTVLCVVEEPKDVATIEKAGVIKGGTTCSAARSARSTGSAPRTSASRSSSTASSATRSPR